MSNVYVVVEGKGEQGFLTKVVAAALVRRGVYVNAVLVGKPGRKGGVRRWASVRNDVVRFLKMDRPTYPVFVSTMFDYYRMPMDWPGRQTSVGLPHSQKAAHVEVALTDDITASPIADFDRQRFIPYIQIYELESLVLAEPRAVATEFPERQAEVNQLVASLGETAPEEINDHPHSAPSVRLIRHVPEYGARKASAVVNILASIGLDTLRARCPHFNDWITSLETIGTR